MRCVRVQVHAAHDDGLLCTIGQLLSIYQKQLLPQEDQGCNHTVHTHTIWLYGYVQRYFTVAWTSRFVACVALRLDARSATSVTAFRCVTWSRRSFHLDRRRVN